jgi:hypothetical protein
MTERLKTELNADCELAAQLANYEQKCLDNAARAKAAREALDLPATWVLRRRLFKDEKP